MIYLRVNELLEKEEKSRYWLVKGIDGNYRTVNNMLEQSTISIRFDTMEKLCNIFNCEPGDLFKRENPFKKE